jgi:hypothetical protein
MRVFIASITSILSIAVTSQALAQTGSMDLDRVRTALLKEVRVTTDAGERMTGVLQSANQEAFTLLTPTGTVELSPINVRRIERPGDSVRNGFIIGAIAGLVYGGLMTAMYEDHTTNKAAALAVGAGMFGLVGAGIDALHKGWTTVYRRR